MLQYQRISSWRCFGCFLSWFLRFVLVFELWADLSLIPFAGEEQLKALKGNAVFVNIGRGTTVDQEKLIEALKATPGEGEDDAATGTLRIGGASLE